MFFYNIQKRFCRRFGLSVELHPAQSVFAVILTYPGLKVSPNPFKSVFCIGRFLMEFA